MYNGEKVGFTSTKASDDGSHIIMTENLTENIDEGIPASIHGVYERGLNSAIDAAHSDALSGVVSGEELLSAPQQYHVLQKFRHRVKLSNDGSHSNESLVLSKRRKDNKDFKLRKTKEATSMLDLRKAGNTIYKTFYNGPVYRLESPTFHVPTKSTAFNPTIIDRFGKMHIDWNNPDIYKSLFPIGLTGAGIYKFGNSENN